RRVERTRPGSCGPCARRSMPPQALFRRSNSLSPPPRLRSLASFMLYLCVSDIHGHLGALSAILATAEKRSFHKLLFAGDIVFPGPQPLETWRRLVAAGAVMVQGVSDKALATLDPDELSPRSEHERARLERMGEVQDELGELI